MQNVQKLEKLGVVVQRKVELPILKFNEMKLVGEYLAGADCRLNPVAQEQYVQYLSYSLI